MADLEDCLRRHNIAFRQVHASYTLTVNPLHLHKTHVQFSHHNDYLRFMHLAAQINSEQDLELSRKMQDMTTHITAVNVYDYATHWYENERDETGAVPVEMFLNVNIYFDPADLPAVIQKLDSTIDIE